MAEYRSNLGGPSQPQVGGPPQEHSLVSALRERFQRPGSPVLKILSALSIPQQVVASMVRENVERQVNPHAPQLDYGEAALRGIADPNTSYGDVPGVGKKAALFYDIAGDPMWFFPAGKVGTAVSRGAREAGVLARKLPGVEHATDRVLTKFVKNYDKIKAGFKTYEEEVEFAARMGENEVTHELVDGTGKELLGLLPNAAKRRAVLELAEVVPPSGATGPLVAEVANLPSTERKAFDLARKQSDIIEGFRKRFGVMDEETARKLEERTGLKYFQRSVAPRDEVVADLTESIAKNAGKWSQEDLDKITKVRDYVANMDPTVNESYVREMQRLMESGVVPKESFQQFRGVEKSIRALKNSEDVTDQILYAMAEKDVARNLHQASVKTARAVYRKLYLDKFIKYMRKNNLLHKEEDLTHLPAALRGRGPTELIPIKGVPELEGYYGPRVLVNDIADMIMSPLDPEKVQAGVGLTRRLNAWWRAWTIGPIPMTHVRNFVDSVGWRNAAGGMKPQDAGHVMKMGQIIKDAANGTLDVADKAIYKDMVRGGVVRSNWVDESRRMINYGMEKKNVFQKWIDPNTSPPVQAGFNVGSKIEDLARGSMFLWRRSKGDSVVEAMKHVNKWHIDYRYGLTPFERKIRDNLIPFYTFSRFNIPLTIETLVHKPKLVVAAGHGIDTVEDVFGGPEPDFPLAGWMAQGTPMRIKYDPGTKNYFVQMLDGWWSFADLNKVVPGRMLTEAINMLSPIVSEPVQLIKNWDLFRSTGANKLLPIERPGDKLKLYGQEADFPFAKRLEHLIKVFRPIRETDAWLEAASSKYGDTAIDRGRNVFNRILFGKVYPTSREEMLRFMKAGTDDQLHALRAAMKRAEEAGDTDTYDGLSQQVEKIKQARKDMGIK